MGRANVMRDYRQFFLVGTVRHGGGCRATDSKIGPEDSSDSEIFNGDDFLGRSLCSLNAFSLSQQQVPL